MIATLNAVSLKEALEIPSTTEFEEQTLLNKEKYIKQVLSDKNWQRANIYLYKKRVTAKIGTRKYSTIPYSTVILNLKKSSEKGSALASFQGYRISSMISSKRGKYAKRDTSFFAKEMMRYDICLGYVETAYGYVNKWYSDTNEWKEASKILKIGKKQCSDSRLPDWLNLYYRKNVAQYKAMSKFEKIK